MATRLNLEQLESRDTPAVTVTEAVSGFLATHTIQQFQYEYWNLLGLRPNAYLNEGNRELAEALGIDDRGHDIISKAYVMKWTTPAQLQAIRTEIADTMGTISGLGEAQKLFLEWNYLSTPNYGTIHTNGTSTVVGWNRAHTFQAATEWTGYTFPLLGCTAIVAYTPEGAGHFSHFDRVVNPTQIQLLGEFLDSHPTATVVVTGISAIQVAREIAFLPNAPARIFTHVKDEYATLSYSIRAAWRDGQMSIDVESRPINGKQYLESCLVSLNPVVFNYPGGHTWEAIPGGDSQYLPLDIYQYTASVSGLWRDNLGNTIMIVQDGRDLTFIYNGSTTYTGLVGWLNQIVFLDRVTGAVTVSGKLSPKQDCIRFNNGVVLIRDQ